MLIIEFRPYRHLDDTKLQEELSIKIKKLRNLSDSQGDRYKTEAKFVNTMIIEVKRRQLSLNNQELIKKILLK